MRDIICINDTFPIDYIEFYKKHGVVTPKKNKIYTIRQIREERGTTSFLLNELVNPQVPVSSPLSGIKWVEPAWKYSRFSTLTGDKIELENFKEELV